MAKIVKRKRKLKIEAFATLFLFMSIFLYLGSATALKSYNVILSNKAERMSLELDDQKAVVATLKTTIKELSNSDRIAQIAKDAGYKSIQSNVKIMDAE